MKTPIEAENSGVTEPSDAELTAIERQIDDYLADIDPHDTEGLYFKEVGRVPLLTAEEEIAICQRMEHGRMAREEMTKGNVDPNRRVELGLLIKDGWQAHEQLITANSRLVISVAKKYLGRGVPFLDLIQEGNIGLIRGTKRFDHQRGYKFSTYAFWWIRQAITRAIADQSRTIRFPVHVSDAFNRMLREKYQLTQNLDREPTVGELAAAVKIPISKIEKMIEMARRPLSLETPTDDEERTTLGDFIEDEKASPPAAAIYKLLCEDLAEILNDLPPREALILQIRYGLLDGQSYTLEEVGRKMGITRERVRQIETKALSHLRHPEIRRKLRDYLGE